ncbi:MAG: Crp/Fnr family transcriptional regulator [Spirochaetia bacterium]|nr:Crp/Fnr family transcriptional regulator [Spirochaetia bacterium]
MLLMQHIKEVQPYYKMLLETELFSKVFEEDMPQLLHCLHARVKNYSADSFIIHAEDSSDEFGVVLQGSVHIITEDMFGNRSITAHLNEGELFGQIATTRSFITSPASVIAVSEEVSIMFLKFSSLVAPCTRACSFHSLVIENMMNVLAKRNLLMNQKLAILSQRTMREKLLAFLYLQYKEIGSNEFDIPFNRDELADFLCVNRSALSREIAKMVDEELIETTRSHFILNEHTFL